MFFRTPAGRMGRNTRTAFLMATLFLLNAPPSEGTEVTFRFRPPDWGNEVSVAGYFNDWNPGANLLADQDDDGVWEVTLDIPPGRQQYKFVVNGAEWIADPFSTESIDDGFGGKNSIVDIKGESMSVGEPEGFVPGSPGGSADSGPKKTEVTFRLKPDKGVSALSVAGSFNSWDAAGDVMADDDGDGVWEVTLSLLPGSYTYQFVVDGDQWISDQFADQHEDDGFGGRNALLEVGMEAQIVGMKK